MAHIDFVAEHPGVPRMLFGELQRPGDTLPKKMVQALIRRYGERLQHLLSAQQQDFNAAAIGKTFPVLFERFGRHDGQLIGRSPYLQPVHVTAPSTAIGNVLPVEITSLGSYSLGGVIVGG